MSSPCSRLIRPSYVKILGKLRTQSHGRRYRSSPTCVSVSSTARSRPWEECWGLWFCRNEHGGSTSPSCQTERAMTSCTCPLSWRGFLVLRWPRCNGGVKPKKRKTNSPALPPSKAPSSLSAAQDLRASCFSGLAV